MCHPLPLPTLLQIKFINKIRGTETLISCVDVHTAAVVFSKITGAALQQVQLLHLVIFTVYNI